MSSQAYTPGLKRKEFYMVRKDRELPILGEVLVKEGDEVQPESPVARALVPGEPHVINVSYELSIIAEDLARFMLKKRGDTVEKGEILALKKGFLGLFKSECVSPYTGTVELISEQSGQVIIRESPVPVEVKAYISGTIEKVTPKQGVVVKTPAAYIQGIFGIGGETSGELMMMSKTHADVSDSTDITSKCARKILVFGALVDIMSLRKAIEIGVKGIIVGGIMGTDLKNLLGVQIGVAITGHENIGLSLIITEGFGKMNMSEKTFELLKKFEGKLASINGSTQIRAGVMRPEIVVPYDIASTRLSREETFISKGLMVGTQVRLIREPYYGALGFISRLPVELQTLESESSVRVLDVKLEDGRTVTIPRANVEIIEA
jgi:hypothetical protein